MTRIDSVRTATDSTKDSVRHAAEVMAPYAENARDTAVHYAQEAGARLGPKVADAAQQARTSARDGYDQYVVPRIAQARQGLPPEVDKAAAKAAKKTRKTARKAAEYAAPRIESAVSDARAAAGPAYEEATARGTAALTALRSGVSAKDIEKLAKRQGRRRACSKLARRLGLLGLVAGGAYAAWRWWDKQANPDWLVEPPAATEFGDHTSVAPIDDTAGAAKDATDAAGAKDAKGPTGGGKDAG